MKRICVFCGSRPGVRPEYRAAAEFLEDAAQHGLDGVEHLPVTHLLQIHRAGQDHPDVIRDMAGEVRYDGPGTVVLQR